MGVMREEKEKQRDCAFDGLMRSVSQNGEKFSKLRVVLKRFLQYE